METKVNWKGVAWFVALASFLVRRFITREDFGDVGLRRGVALA